MGNLNVVSRFSVNRFSPQGSWFTRELNIAGGWSEIRIGMNCQINEPVIGTTIPAAYFFMGLCSGVSDAFGSAPSITHAVGVAPASPGSATWGNSSGYFNGLAFLPTKQVGSTVTQGTTLGSPIIKGQPADSTNRTLVFLDITQGSPNYTFQLFYKSSLSPADPTDSDFETQMQAVTPAFTSHVIGTAQTLAVNEGVDGILDSICFYWRNSQQPIEISALGVYVLA